MIDDLEEINDRVVKMFQGKGHSNKCYQVIYSLKGVLFTVETHLRVCQKCGCKKSVYKKFTERQTDPSLSFTNATTLAARTALYILSVCQYLNGRRAAGIRKYSTSAPLPQLYVFVLQMSTSHDLSRCVDSLSIACLTLTQLFNPNPLQNQIRRSTKNIVYYQSLLTVCMKFPHSQPLTRLNHSVLAKVF